MIQQQPKEDIKILIICALEKEFPPAHNPYKDITFYSGVGKTNATLKTVELIHKFSPDIIINFGTAGSCNPNLSGLIECGTFFDRDDSAKFNPDERIITDSDLYIISSGDNFVTKKIEGCDLVDMEAYSIAKACQKYNVQFKCFKYITDYVNTSSYIDWDMNISNGYLAFLKILKSYSRK